MSVIRKKISLNYNPIISAECSYIQNGFFNDGLNGYDINEPSKASVSTYSDTHLSKVIGENVLNIRPSLNREVIISQEITSFPNGLPNLLSFFAKLSFSNVELNISYYRNNQLLEEHNESLDMGLEYSPYLIELNA